MTITYVVKGGGYWGEAANNPHPTRNTPNSLSFRSAGWRREILKASPDTFDILYKSIQLKPFISSILAIKNYVFTNQDKVIEARNKLEKILVRAHVEAKTAWENGATEAQMKKALQFIRHAQWRWDYSAASHGAAFHASLEIARIICTGIDKAQEARLEIGRVLASLGFQETIAYPDISNKEKAQKYIGLDVEKLKMEKDEFLKNIVPEWKKKAEERQSAWKIKYI